MAKENISAVGIIVMIGVAALLGAVLVSIIADSNNTVTSKTTATETINIAGARLTGGAINTTYYFHLTNGCPYASNWRKDSGSECVLGDSGVKNSSGGALTATTDYVLTTNSATCTGANGGDITFKNTANVNQSNSNTTTVSYTYCQNEYMTNGWQKTVLNMVPGFFALGILIGVAFVIYWILRKEGIASDWN